MKITWIIEKKFLMRHFFVVFSTIPIQVHWDLGSLMSPQDRGKAPFSGRPPR